GFPVGGNGGGDHDDAVLGQQFGHVRDPFHVRVPVCAAEAEPLAQMLPHLVAVQHLYRIAPALQLSRQSRGNGRLPGAGQAGKPDDETSLTAHAGSSSCALYTPRPSICGGAHSAQGAARLTTPSASSTGPSERPAHRASRPPGANGRP